MKDDALWYEAALVVGITNALNVVADALDGTTSGLLPRSTKRPPATMRARSSRRSAPSMPAPTCRCRFE